ncbi:hypothetical protein [Ferrovibrio sp.]|uniref:hypothetical protein n=1 Tax=Ferrovibrio sp. TaxID=1917215 RepID=UPI00311DF2DE
MRNLAVAVLALMTLAACATSQNAQPLATPLPPAPLPDYRVGDRFLFKVGPIEDLQSVIAVEADIITYQTRVFGTVRQSRAFANPANWSGGSFAGPMKVETEGRIDSLFPLRVGNVATTKGVNEFAGRTTKFTLTCRVPRQESITVTAGRFDTIVVECEYVHELGSYFFTYWYAPAVGHWVAVRRDGRYQELASWTRAGQ